MSKKVLVTLDDETVARVEAAKNEEQRPSLSDAVRWLTMIGLDARFARQVAAKEAEIADGR